jgi:membrane protein YdbS with pleckstrin-like domain
MGGSDGKSAAGDRLLKIGVIILCSINAVMWEFYTESTVMALFWAAIAIAFVIWIGKDMRR